MTSEQILRLVLSLPADSPFFEAAFHDEPWKWPPSLPERLHVGLFDPAFGWHLSRSYASESMPLPAQDWPQDWPPEIRRAHRHLLDRDEEDDNLALAQALHLPQNLAERDLMWALLICQDASFEMIADVFNYEVDVVRLVDTLFWNFRDRKHEPLYVAQVLNGPQAGAALPERGERNPELKLVRLACRTGEAKIVLAAAGMSPFPEESITQLLADQIEQDLLVQAAAGGLESRARALVHKYLLPHVTPEQSEEVDPLEALGISQEEFLAYRRDEIERQLRLQADSGPGK